MSGHGGWQTGAGLALGLGPAVFSSLFAPPVAGFRTAGPGAVGIAANCGTVDSTSSDDQGGAPAGIACAFPFQYDGAVYSACVGSDADTMPWCATADWNNPRPASAPYVWGYCNASCSTDTEMGTDLDLAAGANPSSSGDGAANDDSMPTAITFVVMTSSVVAIALIVAAVFKMKFSYNRSRAAENKLVVRQSQATDHTYDLAGNVNDRPGKMAAIKDRKTPHESDHDHYDMATSGPIINNNDNLGKLDSHSRSSSAGSDISEISDMPSEYGKMVKLANPKTATSMDYLDGCDNMAEVTEDERQLYPLAAPSDHFDTSGRVASPVTVGPKGVTVDPKAARDAVAKQVAATIDELRKHELTEGDHVPVLIPATNAQNHLSAYKRVNEQARGEFAGQKTAFNTDAKQIQTELKAQQDINAVRRVNEQARGELVGHKNAFDADAQQIQTELKAQQEISVVRRVNEQVLSPEAGQQTKVALDAKFITEEMGLQVRVNRNNRVNEELTSPYAGASTSYTTTAPQMSNELSQQVMLNEVNRVNTNFRAGAMTGLKTNLKNHAGMKHAGAQQAAVSQLSRVNEQARGGEFTGVSTSYNLDSEEMRNYKRNQGQTSAANRESGLMFGDIGKDGANADAGYHHDQVEGYMEVGSKFQLSNTMRGQFETMMGGPTDNTVPAERLAPPSRKKFDMEKAVTTDSSKEQSTPTSNGPSKRMAEI